MRYLLDTHILIWSIMADDQLSKEAYRIINDTENSIFYSVVSIWEVMIKQMKSPTRIPFSGVELAEYCKKAGFIHLSMIQEHAFLLSSLKRDEQAPSHNDPFDRIFIAQAKAENLLFLTHDKTLKYYNESCVKLV